jgi:hypothetical protein
LLVLICGAWSPGTMKKSKIHESETIFLIAMAGEVLEPCPPWGLSQNDRPLWEFYIEPWISYLTIYHRLMDAALVAWCLPTQHHSNCSRIPKKHLGVFKKSPRVHM